MDIETQTRDEAMESYRQTIENFLSTSDEKMVELWKQMVNSNLYLPKCSLDNYTFVNEVELCYLSLAAREKIFGDSFKVSISQPYPDGTFSVYGTYFRHPYNRVGSPILPLLKDYLLTNGFTCENDCDCMGDAVYVNRDRLTRYLEKYAGDAITLKSMVEWEVEGIHRFERELSYPR